MHEPKVLVMMATYNGGRFVSEQIDSVLNQQDVLITLRISDDGSSDDTCQICEDYAARFDNVLFQRNDSNKGVGRNFMDMVHEADAGAFDFFAFSDQDDVWLPAKIVEAIRSIGDTSDPSLYYSEVDNVDAHLKSLNKKSFSSYSAIADRLDSQLLTNWASGCTMVFNSEFCRLLQRYRPEDYWRIHDAWAHSVALACGRCVVDLDRSFIKRRITGENVVGENQFASFSPKRLIEGVKATMKTWKQPSVFYGNARQLLDGYGDIMSPDKKKAVVEFLNMDGSFMARLCAAFGRKYKMPWPRETFIMHIRIMLGLV